MRCQTLYVDDGQNAVHKQRLFEVRVDTQGEYPHCSHLTI